MMKNVLLTLAMCLVGLFVVAALSGCKGPDGPAGPAGKDASVGSLEGYADGIKCATCHNADTDTTERVAAKAVQYEMSGHRELGNYDRNTTTCGGCHTNEGFYERYNNGFANETFTLTAASGPMINQNYYNSSPVGCFTCHSPHKRGNFTVRDSGAVTINTLVTTQGGAAQAGKVWNSTSSSNLCVKCHQPRMTSHFLIPGTTATSWQPNPSKTAATDTAKIYTTRWNNHVSGETAQMLLGFGGFEFTGYTNYANSGHTSLVNGKALGCEDCHMATPIGNKGGGHTFKVGYIPEGATTTSYNLAGCNNTSCHAGAVTTSSTTYWKVRDEISAKLTQLGKLMLDTTITKKWSLPQAGKAKPWLSITVTGTDTAWSGASASGTTPLVIVPAFKAGALWNFYQVEYEASKGIHNYKYAKALLDNSIAELTK